MIYLDPFCIDLICENHDEIARGSILGKLVSVLKASQRLLLPGSDVSSWNFLTQLLLERARSHVSLALRPPFSGAGTGQTSL